MNNISHFTILPILLLLLSSFTFLPSIMITSFLTLFFLFLQNLLLLLLQYLLYLLLVHLLLFYLNNNHLILPCLLYLLPLPLFLMKSPPPKQSTRIHKAPSYLKDYACTVTASSPPHWCNLVSYDSLPSSHKIFFLMLLPWLSLLLILKPLKTLNGLLS